MNFLNILTGNRKPPYYTVMMYCYGDKSHSAAVSACNRIIKAIENLKDEDIFVRGNGGKDEKNYN